MFRRYHWEAASSFHDELPFPAGGLPQLRHQPRLPALPGQPRRPLPAGHVPAPAAAPPPALRLLALLVAPPQPALLPPLQLPRPQPGAAAAEAEPALDAGEGGRRGRGQPARQRRRGAQAPPGLYSVCSTVRGPAVGHV